MAPKKRDTRMYAAYDHLCPLGFSKSLIRSKVKSLLKVYGEEGWAFFEADAYSVLIEAILEEQEKHSSKSDSLEDTVEAASTLTRQPNQASSSTQQPNKFAEEHACTDSEPVPVPVLELKLDKEPGFLGFPLQEPIASPPRRKRTPCFGWISSDNEEDTVVLETEFSLLRQKCGSEIRRRKRQSGWDIKPEDFLFAQVLNFPGLLVMKFPKFWSFNHLQAMVSASLWRACAVKQSPSFARDFSSREALGACQRTRILTGI